MRQFWKLALAAAGLALCITASAEDKTELMARMDRVDALTRLDTADLKPWYMKLSFQLYDPDGKPKETGTLEEWRRGPNEYKIAVTSKSYTATTLVDPQGMFRTAGKERMPYLLEVLERQMVHPLARPDEVAGLSPQTLKNEWGPPAECVMYSKPLGRITAPPLGILPSYCMVPGKDLLISDYDFSTLAVVRVSMGMFQKRVMPTEVQVLLSRVNALSAKLLALQTVPLKDDDFATTGMEPADAQKIKLPFSDILPRMVRATDGSLEHWIPAGMNPSVMSLPTRANILIGTDGRVHSVRLVEAADAKLVTAALGLMLQWKFEVQKRDGKPVEVITTGAMLPASGP